MVDVPDELRKYIGTKDLNSLPDGLKRYKCPICHAAGFDTPVCPDCGFKEPSLMCPLDHCGCSHDITSGVNECPICGDYICPECGSHDVTVITRITGYLNDLRGFNAAKAQEVKDRHRINIEDEDV